MNLIWEGFRNAWQLIIGLDPLVYDAAWRSIWITSLAVFIAAVLGLPIGSLLARSRSRFRHVWVVIFRAGMALPTVFVGIVCYALLTQQGPLGTLGLLYTPWAIVAGEVILALPIIVSLSYGAVRSLDNRVGETALTLGAGPVQRWVTYLREAKLGITLAIMTAYGRCVTELGIAMIVGGNIKLQTRTLTTATTLEAGQGEFGRALAMGLILLLIALVVALVIGWLGREKNQGQGG